MKPAQQKDRRAEERIQVSSNADLNLSLLSPAHEEFVAKLRAFSKSHMTFVVPRPLTQHLALKEKDILAGGELAWSSGKVIFGRIVIQSIRRDAEGFDEISVFLYETRIPVDKVKDAAVVDDWDTEGVPQFKPYQEEVNRRSAARINIRKGEGVSAKITGFLGENQLEWNAEVYDVSSLGIALIIEDKSGRLELKELSHIKVDLALTKTDHYSFTCDLRSAKRVRKDAIRLGLRFNHNDTIIDLDGQVVDGTPMLAMPSKGKLGGVIYKEHFYSERCDFELLGISKKHARVLLTDSELLLFQGMNVELSFYLETTSVNKLVGKVKRLQEVQFNQIVFDIEIEDFPKPLENVLVGFLIQSFQWSPEYIRSFGLVVRQISDAFKFRYIRTHEEYIEVLKLRYETYMAAGKITEKNKLKDMVAPLDSISRILAVYHHDQLVASMALTFPEKDDVILDTERALPDGFPKSLPKKQDLIEISRLCTKPEYRRGDLVKRIFEYVFHLMVTSGRDYILSSTDRKLWPLYKSIGMKKAGVQYEHPVFKGVMHDIILIHVSTGLTSKGINPISWGFLYSKMYDFLGGRYEDKGSFFVRLKLKLYKFIFSLTRFS